MNKNIVYGVDLAKNVFQVHGTDHLGNTCLRKKLQRSKVIDFFSNKEKALIGIEACSGAHYWARELEKLGHTVKMMAPQYVKPYVKTNKNDAANAEAICEAVTWKNMRFVPLKSIQAQNLQAIHRARKRLVRDKVSLINEVRGLLGEYGIVIPRSVAKFNQRMPELLTSEDLSPSFKETLQDLYSEYLDKLSRIKKFDERLKREFKSNEICQNLGTIKGIGVIGATALVTTNPSVFKNGREFASWLGLTPKQHSSGGKTVLLGIGKRGNPYLREVLVHGARVFLQWSDKNDDPLSVWARKLKDKKGHNKACIAVANKLARIAWTIMNENRAFDKAIC